MKLLAPSAVLWRKPHILGSDGGDTPTSSPPWEHHFWRCALVKWDHLLVFWRIGVILALQRHGVFAAWRNGVSTRVGRRHHLAPCMVASLVGSTRFMQILTMKTTRWFDGGDDFSSMHWRSFFEAKPCHGPPCPKVFSSLSTII
jgi:hypothetical protein